MRKYERYSPTEKKLMVKLYAELKTYDKVAKQFGCASSTVYYAVNEDAYERHKEHVYYMSKQFH